MTRSFDLHWTPTLDYLLLTALLVFLLFFRQDMHPTWIDLAVSVAVWLAATYAQLRDANHADCDPGGCSIVASWFEDEPRNADGTEGL